MVNPNGLFDLFIPDNLKQQDQSLQVSRLLRRHQCIVDMAEGRRNGKPYYKTQDDGL